MNTNHWKNELRMPTIIFIRPRLMYNNNTKTNVKINLEIYPRLQSQDKSRRFILARLIPEINLRDLVGLILVMMLSEEALIQCFRPMQPLLIHILNLVDKGCSQYYRYLRKNKNLTINLFCPKRISSVL